MENVATGCEVIWLFTPLATSGLGHGFALLEENDDKMISLLDLAALM